MILPNVPYEKLSNLHLINNIFAETRLIFMMELSKMCFSRLFHSVPLFIFYSLGKTDHANINLTGMAISHKTELNI